MGLVETVLKGVIQKPRVDVNFTTITHIIKPQKHRALREYFELTRSNIAMQSSLINCNLHSSVIYKKMFSLVSGESKEKLQAVYIMKGIV